MLLEEINAVVWWSSYYYHRDVDYFPVTAPHAVCFLFSSFTISLILFGCNSF